MVGLFGGGIATGFAPLSIGVDVLTVWYQARSVEAVARAPASSASAAQKSSVTPPWDPGAKPAPLEELRRSVLASGRFIDADDLAGYSDKNAPLDHKKLFALHQALKALRAIAEEAVGKTVLGARRAFLDRRFQEGLAQVDAFLATANFESLAVARGAPVEKIQTNLSIPRTRDVFTTGVLHDGDYDAEVDGFQGDVAFTITAKRFAGDVVVDIDLADMTDPRTLDNVADFINQKLADAALVSRFKRVKLGAADASGVVSGSHFGFEISGVSTERLVFSAPTSTASLTLAGVSGAKTEEAGTAGQVTRITDLDVTPVVSPSRRLETAAAEDGITVKAAKAASDGGVYVLGTATGALASGLTPIGDQDAVLVKYDSTGRQVWARALGATGSAEGLSLAVDADGDVIVAGAVTGALGTTVDRGGSDVFVARYTAKGAEEWVQRLGTLADDAATALTVGADGTIYVAGRTGATITGASNGGQDAFVRALDADGATLWTRQIGTSGTDVASALAIADDGELLMATVEDGQGILRKLDADDGGAAAIWEHVLGDLDFGSIAGIAVDGTSIYVAGAARSGYALTGSVLAHSGARDAFVVRLEDGAAPTQTWGTFVGGAGEDVAADILVYDGAVYIAGRTASDLPGGGTLVGDKNAFVTRLDVADGAVAWSTEIAGRGGIAEGAGLVVDAQGSSALEKLGLPRGELVYADSRVIAERSAARAGDYFYIRVNGGAKRKVTIDADDTMRALSFKVQAALVLDGEAKVKRLANGDALEIAPKEGVRIELIAGGEGQDLLKSLGLPAGIVEKQTPQAAEEVPQYGLELAAALSMKTRDDAIAAGKSLDDAMSTIRGAYRELTLDPALKALADQNAKNKAAGPPPAYLLQRLAQYQDALARLGGGGSSGFGFF